MTFNLTCSNNEISAEFGNTTPSKELFVAVEAWAKTQKKIYSNWVNYIAIKQGKYISVYYITYDNEADAKTDMPGVENIVENRVNLDYAETGTIDEDTFNEMICDDDFRNILDVEWYRGTDKIECCDVEGMNRSISMDVSDY